MPATLAAAALVLACALPLRAAEKPPDGHALLRRYVSASGGHAAYASLQSLKLTARIEVPARDASTPARTLRVTRWQQRPDRILVETSVEGVGVTRQGFDGSTGWSEAPGKAPRLLEGNELEQLRREADQYLQLDDPAAAFPRAETIGMSPFEDGQAWAVQVRTRRRQDMTFFFDPESGFLVGLATSLVSPTGEIGIASSLSQPRKFGALTLATRIEHVVNGSRPVMTIESFVANPKDLPSFAPPPGLAGR